MLLYLEIWKIEEHDEDTVFDLSYRGNSYLVSTKWEGMIKKMLMNGNGIWSEFLTYMQKKAERSIE